ncbi:MAG: ferritin-like domain-containing protein [Candidatus Kapaibacterium sp.]
MAGGSGSYHEPYELLSEETKNMHRALVTVMEELEAIDWYQQRAEGCSDPELKSILLHNKNEEIEHAMMTIEWIRRKNPTFSDQAKTYLFSEGPITQVEKAAMAKEGGSGGGEQGGGNSSASLGIGSLKRGGR